MMSTLQSLATMELSLVGHNMTEPVLAVFIQSSSECSHPFLETATTTDRTCVTADRESCQATVGRINPQIKETEIRKDAKNSKRVYLWQRDPNERDLSENEVRSIKKAIKCRKERMNDKAKNEELKGIVRDQNCEIIELKEIVRDQNCGINELKETVRDQNCKIKELEAEIAQLKISNCQACSIFENL